MVCFYFLPPSFSSLFHLFPLLRTPTTMKMKIQTEQKQTTRMTRKMTPRTLPMTRTMRTKGSPFISMRTAVISPVPSIRFRSPLEHLTVNFPQSPGAVFHFRAGIPKKRVARKSRQKPSAPSQMTRLCMPTGNQPAAIRSLTF